MILNTGQRTDIPAFYSDWFLQRVREGFVLVRSPYDPHLVTRYLINPSVVDAIAFCTKNPLPMLDHLSELSAYRMFWFVTITPYGKDIEPRLPDKRRIVEGFRKLSGIVGADHTALRYDPVFINETYPIEKHIRAFERLCTLLEGSTHMAVISFLDLYEKTKRNFPEGKEASEQERLMIGEAFARSCQNHGIRPYTCLEGTDLARFGFDCSGCMSKAVLEHALNIDLSVPSSKASIRPGCTCLIGSDIGAYNSCGHGCRYCYANESEAAVRRTMAQHDPSSPLLIGHLQPEDRVHDTLQKSWINLQLHLDL